MSKQKTAPSNIFNILAFRFDGRKGAEEALKAAKESGALEGYTIAAEATVEQDEKGKVHFHEPGHGAVGGTIGVGAGALLGLIGGPAGVLAWAVAGGAIGGVAGHYMGRVLSRGDMKEIGEALSPDTSFLLVLLEDTESEAVIKSMEGYSANVVTLTVGDELSGEIASFVAGEATDGAGNTVAGEAAIAADAEGDVAAEGEIDTSSDS
jgi:uncharacterized membrane protein